MLCPFDAATLQVVNRSGVEIDWCPSCKGVWLERGELDKLIDMAAAAPAAAPPAPRPASPYADPRGHERRGWDDDDHDRRKYGDGHRSKKRKGLLSEIFDF